MAAVILLQSSPKQTAKQPWPPVLSRLQLWKMPLQRESVGEYLWDPKSKWVLAEIFFLYTVLFMKYLSLWPLCLGSLFICAVITAGKSSISVLGDAGCRQSWDSSLCCYCCVMGTEGGGWSFSSPSPALLHTFSRPSPGLSLGWWLLTGTCQAEWWWEGTGCWTRSSTSSSGATSGVWAWPRQPVQLCL